MVYYVKRKYGKRESYPVSWGKGYEGFATKKEASLLVKEAKKRFPKTKGRWVIKKL